MTGIVRNLEFGIGRRGGKAFAEKPPRAIGEKTALGDRNCRDLELNWFDWKCLNSEMEMEITEMTGSVCGKLLIEAKLVNETMMFETSERLGEDVGYLVDTGNVFD